MYETESFEERRRRIRAENDKLDNQAKGCLGFIAVAWVASAILGLGILGLVVWGLVELIMFLQRN